MLPQCHHFLLRLSVSVRAPFAAALAVLLLAVSLAALSGFAAVACAGDVTLATAESEDTPSESTPTNLSSNVSTQMESLREEYARLKADSAALQAQRAAAGGAPEALKSADGRSTVRIGGEMNTDYIANLRNRGNHNGGGNSTDTSWAMHSTNLRFGVDLSPEVKAYIKLDLGSKPTYLQDQILEEAKLVWSNIDGGPFSVIFGKGEAPYGQDRTLGIIQSYHHNEGSYSSEGPIILNGPQGGAAFNQAGQTVGPVYHPGEIDRVVMAGVGFDWDDIVHAEVAVFQPNDWANPSLRDDMYRDGDLGVESFCGRIWWKTPVEGLVAEASGVRQHMRQRGDTGRYGADAVEDEYAASTGLDWNLPGTTLELFTEYEHGWNWNYTDGYNTDTVSFGALYGVTEKLRAGAMAEWLSIDDRGARHDYNKFVLHADYTFTSGLYLMAEYGYEVYNWSAAQTQTFAMRTGFRF